jgi:hypothetical protein
MKNTLTWNPSPEADLAGYKVYRSVGTGPLTLLNSVPKGTTTFVDDPIPNIDGDIGYALTAIDVAGNESIKSAVVVKTVNVVPPQAPTGLAVVTS